MYQFTEASDPQFASGELVPRFPQAAMSPYEVPSQHIPFMVSPSGRSFDSVSPIRGTPPFSLNPSSKLLRSSTQLKHNFTWAENAPKMEHIGNWKIQQETVTLVEPGSELKNHVFNAQFDAKYRVDEYVGHGATALVMACTRREDNESVITKFIYKDRIPISNWVRDRQLGTIPREIFIMKRLSHRNIVDFYDAYEDNKFFYVVMESLSSSVVPHPAEPVLHGIQMIPGMGQPNEFAISAPSAYLGLKNRRISKDLFETIETHKTMPEFQVKHIFKQVVDAIEYLHVEKNFVHRDIKDENIVVDENLNVKVIDFGAAQSIPSSRSSYFDTFNGTSLYAAPEIVRGESYRGPPQDIWALGVLLYVLAFGKLPFLNAQATILGRYNTDASREKCMEVLRNCLCVDIDKRWTITELSECEWLN